MTIAELNTLYASAAAFMAAEAWRSAIPPLMQIQARLATTPNLTRGLGGGGSQGITWNPGEIANLIATCNKMIAADAGRDSTSGPWQTSKVTYKRATT